MGDKNGFSSIEQGFFESLYQHKRYVYEAGLLVGGIPLERLFNHDASKFLPEEFPHYARHFFGDKGDPDGFASAWLHHIHHNPHHWQHWIFPDGFSPKGSQLDRGLVPMPEIYVREMVADWMGASRAYTNSWDMTDWLAGHLPKLETNLHNITIIQLSQVLLDLGYGIVHDLNWPVR